MEFAHSRTTIYDNTKICLYKEIEIQLLLMRTQLVFGNSTYTSSNNTKMSDLYEEIEYQFCQLEHKWIVESP